MHNLYIAEIYRPATFCMGQCAFTSTHQVKSYIIA